MTSRRRRPGRVLLRKSMHSLRRHYLSVATGAVLGGAALVALTSAAFEIERVPEPPPVAAAGDEPAPAPTVPPTAVPPDPFELRTVLYYIVESDEQAAELYSARRADAHYLSEQGLPPLPLTQVYYLTYESRQEELEGQRLLYELAVLAPHFGVDFMVVDLRQ